MNDSEPIGLTNHQLADTKAPQPSEPPEVSKSLATWLEKTCPEVHFDPHYPEAQIQYISGRRSLAIQIIKFYTQQE